MHLSQCLNRAVQVAGDEIATIDGDRVLTWNDCGSRVRKLAGAIRNTLGLDDGGRQLPAGFPVQQPIGWKSHQSLGDGRPLVRRRDHDHAPEFYPVLPGIVARQQLPDHQTAHAVGDK